MFLRKVYFVTVLLGVSGWAWADLMLSSSGLIPGVKDGLLVARAIIPQSSAERAGIPVDLIITEVDRGNGFEIVDKSNVNSLVECLSSPQKPVRLKGRNGRTYEIVRENLSLTPGRLPQSNVPPGILSISTTTRPTSGGVTAIGGNQGHTAVPSGRGQLVCSYNLRTPNVASGDEFLAYRGSEILAVVTLTQLGSSMSQVNVRPQPGLAPAREDTLDGARLAFFQTAPVQFIQAQRTMPGLTGDAPRAKVMNPEIQRYRYQDRARYLWLPSVGVHNLDRYSKTFEVSMMKGSNIPGVGSAYSTNPDAARRYTVSYRGARILFSDESKDAGKDAMSPLESGEITQVEIFVPRPFEEEGVLKAELIVLQRERGR